MRLDVFSASIVLAVVALVAYMIAEYATHKKLENPLNAVAVSLSTGAFVVGCHLVWVAVKGDIGELPPDVWRWHIGIAGMVSIAVSLHRIVGTVQKMLSKSARPQKTKADDNGD